MFGAFRYMINARGCSFDMLGHLVTAHLSWFVELELYVFYVVNEDG